MQPSCTKRSSKSFTFRPKKGVMVRVVYPKFDSPRAWRKEARSMVLLLSFKKKGSLQLTFSHLKNGWLEYYIQYFPFWPRLPGGCDGMLVFREMFLWNMLMLIRFPTICALSAEYHKASEQIVRKRWNQSKHWKPTLSQLASWGGNSG